MSDGRKKLARAGKFFLAWLVFTGLILTLGGWLGGWVTPQLFFVALFTVATPWSIGVLVAVLLVTAILVTGWAVTQYYAEASEEIVVAPEAQEVKEAVQSEVTNASPQPSEQINQKPVTLVSEGDQTTQNRVSEEKDKNSLALVVRDNTPPKNTTPTVQNPTSAAPDSTPPVKLKFKTPLPINSSISVVSPGSPSPPAKEPEVLTPTSPPIPGQTNTSTPASPSKFSSARLGGGATTTASQPLLSKDTNAVPIKPAELLHKQTEKTSVTVVPSVFANNGKENSGTANEASTFSPRGGNSQQNSKQETPPLPLKFKQHSSTRIGLT